LRLDPDPKVRAEVAQRGEALGPNALVVLKRALGDENLGVRLAALRGLLETKDETARIIVREYAEAPLDDMAVAAAAELARRGDPLGLERLLAGLESRRPGIRVAALLRLERGKVKKSDAIALGMIDDPSPLVVYQAAAQLAKHRKHKPTAIKALKKIALEHALHADKARDLLATIGDKAALSHVALALKQDDKTTVLQILGRVDRTKALRTDFALLMASPDQAIRIAGAKAVLTATN
jgi:HEAT repeat protein